MNVNRALPKWFEFTIDDYRLHDQDRDSIISFASLPRKARHHKDIIRFSMSTSNEITLCCHRYVWYSFDKAGRYHFSFFMYFRCRAHRILCRLRLAASELISAMDIWDSSIEKWCQKRKYCRWSAWCSICFCHMLTHTAFSVFSLFIAEYFSLSLGWFSDDDFPLPGFQQAFGPRRASRHFLFTDILILSFHASLLRWRWPPLPVASWILM